MDELRIPPDYVQTGMHPKRTLISLEAQLSELERHQNSVMGSCKTVRASRDEGEKEARVRTFDDLAEEGM